MSDGNSTTNVCPNRARESPIEYLVSAVWAGVIGWPFVKPGSYVVGFDTVSYSGPAYQVTRELWSTGRLPVWSSGSFGGTPHLANPQHGVFYPLRLLGFGLGTNRALGLMAFGHLLILALGMVWLVRTVLKRTPPAGAFASMLVLGSGAIMTKSFQFEQLLVVAWTPWLLGAAYCTITRPRPARSATALTIFAALTLVAGHPQLVYILAPLAAGFSFVVAWGTRRPKRLAVVALAGVIAIGLAMPQLLPTALATTRQADTAAARRLAAVDPAYHVQRPRLISTLLADPRTSNPTFAAGNFEGVGFLGTVGLVVAIAGFVDLRRKRATRGPATAFAGIALLTVLLALGPDSPLHEIATDVVPGYDLARVPARWIVAATFVIALFAAQGIHALRRHRTGWGTAARVWGTVAVVGLVAGVTELDLPGRRTIAFWLALVFMATWALSRRHIVRWATVVLLVAMSVELGIQQRKSFARAWSRPTPVEKFPALIPEFLSAQPGRSIALTNDNLGDPGYLIRALRPNVGDLHGVRSLDGYDGGVMVTQRWSDAIALLTPGKVNPALPLRSQLATPVDPVAAATLGVRYLVVDTSRPDAISARTGWEGPVAVDDTLQVWENPAFIGEAVIVSGIGHRSPAEVVQRRPGRVEIRTATAGSVRIDEQFDEGWEVTVDGKKQQTSEVDRLYVGAQVDGEPHQVVFTYRPKSVRLGLVVAALSVVAGLVALIVARRRLPLIETSGR